MAEYTIRDPETGREVKISGDQPPTPEDIDAIFASMPSVETIQPQQQVQSPSVSDYGMELVTGFNRPMASLVDIATAPGQALLNLAGFNVPTLRSTVAERGEFAGQGPVTDVMAAAGEIGGSAMTMGGITSTVANGLRDVARFGDDVLSRVMQSLGGRGPVKDAIEGMAAGAGGEILAQQASERLGPEYEQYGRIGGELLSPAVWSATSNQIVRLSKNILEEAAPSVQQLRGASRANFAMLDEAGIRANGPSSSMLEGFIDSFIESNGISPATGMPTLSSRLNQIKMAASEGKVTYGFLADAISELKKIGSGSDTQSTLSKNVASDLDDILVKMVPDSEEALGGQSVSEVLDTARALWRRASVSQTIDNIFNDARIDATRTRSDFTTKLRAGLGSLIKSDSPQRKYLSSGEIKLIDKIVSGGRFENMLELAEKVGFNSTDLVRSVIFQGVVGGGTFALSGSQAAAGAAIVGSTALGAFMKSQANRIFKNNANFARALIRAGSDGEDIARTYMRYVPAKDRNPRDLTILFLNGNADLSAAKSGPLAKSPLISDSIALALAAQPIINNEAQSEQ